MPNWLPEPPALSGPYAFRIVRTPTDKPLVAVATCTDLIGVNTHFVHNRTIPCEGVGLCKACDEGHSWRWHCYLSAVLQPGLEHALLEFTAASSETLRNYQLVYGSIRGCLLKAYRPSKRHNGRVVITAQATDPAKTRLPDPPDVKAILCHIWGVQHSKATTGVRNRLPAVQLHVDPGNGDARNQP